jgi:hypothetical protein
MSTRYLFGALASLLLAPVLSANAQDSTVAMAAPSTSAHAPSIAPAAHVRSLSLASEQRAGGRTHDGFFLRLQVGAAVGGTSYDAAAASGVGSDRVHTVGAGAVTQVAVGWSVYENLILHANLHLAQLSGLKRAGGESYDEENEVSTLVGFFGAGASYYFMPANIYVSGAIGPGGVSEIFGPNHEDYESDVGFGSSLTIGKEWWIGRHAEWALGVALTGSYYRAPLEVDGVDSNFQAFLGGALLSATYN